MRNRLYEKIKEFCFKLLIAIESCSARTMTRMGVNESGGESKLKDIDTKCTGFDWDAVCFLHIYPYGAVQTGDQNAPMFSLLLSSPCPVSSQGCLLLPPSLSKRAWSEQEPGSRQSWDSWPKLIRDTPCLVTSHSEIKCVSAYFKREPLLGDWMGIGLVMAAEAFCIPCGGILSPLCKTILILIHELSCFLLS